MPGSFANNLDDNLADKLVTDKDCASLREPLSSLPRPQVRHAAEPLEPVI